MHLRRRLRRPALLATVLVATASMTLLQAGSAFAASGTYGANWQMNEKKGPMLDSSGNHNNSKRIMAGITRDGFSYHFSGLGSVIVPNRQSLQPGNRSFQMSARVSLDQTGDQNFFQKGGLSATLGQYKIEISGTHVHCRIAGTTGVASIWFWGVGKSMIHKYHTITCTKYPDHVTASFDKWTKTVKVAVGSVTTPRNVTIGGKGSGCGTDCDYLTGNIDWATLTYL